MNHISTIPTMYIRTYCVELISFSILYSRLPQLIVLKRHMANCFRYNATLIAVLGEGLRKKHPLRIVVLEEAQMQIVTKFC